VVVAKFEVPSLIFLEGLRKTTINFAQETEVRTAHIPNTCHKRYHLIQAVLSPNKLLFFKILVLWSLLNLSVQNQPII
jgi:hypothetical protein